MVYAGSRFGHWVQPPHGEFSPLWPASAVAIAGLLWRGLGPWPGVWLGSFIFHWLFLVQTGEGSAWDMPLAALLAVSTTIQALAGAALVKGWLRGRDPGTADSKIAALRNAGIEVADSPADMGAAMGKALGL
jgi:hypothetical protein